MAARHHFHGLEIAMRSFSGARVVRVIHPPGQLIGDHRHDWPLLTLPALGGYREDCDDGKTEVAGPAVVFHPAGQCHANCIHERGMETVSIEFDPTWVGISPARLNRTRYWLGGPVPIQARALVHWMDSGASERSLLVATKAFLEHALTVEPREPPQWLPEVRRQLSNGTARTARSIAHQIGLNPRWLAHAYRSVVGEGLQETIARSRCEEAAHLLRTSGQDIADIAAECGFCDQSHLNRTLRRLIGRTPAQVRAEREDLSRLIAG